MKKHSLKYQDLMHKNNFFNNFLKKLKTFISMLKSQNNLKIAPLLIVLIIYFIN